MKKHFTLRKFPALILVCFLAACNSSSDDVTTTPDMTTNDVIVEAAGTSAWSGGFTTSTSITAYGVCYSSSNPEPTIADSKTSEPVSYSSFTSNITGLTPNTQYYLRAYATFSDKTGYGRVVKFTTGADLSAAYGQVSTYAGSVTGGFANGSLLTAQFYNPMGVASDAAGNLYVADSFNSSIRKISAEGLVSSIAGTGSLGYANGAGNVAQFYSPSALAVDALGTVYVADRGNNAIRKITAGGIVSTLAGSGVAGYADGTGEAATFNTPSGIAIDAAGNLIVADNGNNLIRKITPAGVVTTIAGSRTVGYANASGTAANFNKPTAIAIDANGIIYVAEPANYAIRKISSDMLVTTFAGGPGAAALLGSPNALSFDAGGNLWISDGNGRILKIDADKKLTVAAGTSGVNGSTDGVGNAALFSAPTGIAATAAGVYVADFNNNVIRKVN